MLHRSITRRNLWWLPLLICLSASCGDAPSGSAAVLRIGLEGNPTNLDPRFATDAYSTRILPLVYEGLLQPDPQGILAPGLAESWAMVDPVTYRFTLREGLQWQDGSPLTSADVAATFRFLADPKNKCPAQDTFQRLAGIETPDERTILLRLNDPFTPFLEKMTRAIVPAKLQDPAALEAGPIGSGPYRLTAYDRGRLVVLEANEKYRGGAPAIKRLEFVVVVNDTTRLLRLEKGDLHLVLNAVPPYAVKFFEKRPGWRVRRAPGVNYSYLGFNLADKKGLVSDARVRQAVALAIDREQIIKTLLFDTARPADGLLVPNNWAYEKNVMTYPSDPAAAKRLLDEAGWPDPDGDGPRPRFALSYKTSTSKLRMRIADVLAQQLAAVGIRLDRRSLEWGTFFEDIKNGNFQTYTLIWVGVTDPDHLYYVFHSSMQPPKGANRGRYVNRQVDGWLDQSRRTTILEDRKNLYRRVQRQIAEDCVYVSLWWADNVVVHTDRLEGFVIYPGGEYLSLARARLKP